MMEMSMRISSSLIGPRPRRAALGFAVALVSAALFCTPALAVTDVNIQGTVLAVDSGEGPNSAKPGPEGPETNRISMGAGITAVQASSGGGNDSIVVGELPAPSVTLNGDDDDDTLAGIDAAAVEDAAAAGQILNGGRGDDQLKGGAGPDVFNGDEGFDTVSYADHLAAGVLVTIGSPFNDGNTSDAGVTGALDSVASTVERVKGSFFADILKGDAGDNVLMGAAGDDRLKGKQGRDRLKGKGGNDVLLARDGTADLSINCGPGSNSLERASFDKRLDPKPKSC
jgi:Ca2+-binding RTX toxin-like protein